MILDKSAYPKFTLNRVELKVSRKIWGLWMTLCLATNTKMSLSKPLLKISLAGYFQYHWRPVCWMSCESWSRKRRIIAALTAMFLPVRWPGRGWVNSNSLSISWHYVIKQIKLLECANYKFYWQQHGDSITNVIPYHDRFWTLIKNYSRQKAWGLLTKIFAGQNNSSTKSG